jgi:hypothetical protein
VLGAELAAFDRHVARARDLAAAAASLEHSLTGAMDLTDMYRAAFVQGVSALDTFIHAEVRVRMIDTFFGPDSGTPAFDRFRVSLASVSAALASQNQPAVRINWLDAEIREQHSYLSFQQPDKVADAVRLISDVKLWDELALHLGQGPVSGDSGAKVLKRRLTLIVDRRNTIVHESDLDPTPPGDQLYPMTRATADDALDFLQSLVHGIVAIT